MTDAGREAAEEIMQSEQTFRALLILSQDVAMSFPRTC
jgi:hypothetical protein